MVAGSVSQIHARNAALYIQKTAITFSANTSIDQAQGSATIFKVKNLTITPPMSEVEVINLWGSDALDTIGSGVPNTGTFQIQAMEEKSWTLAKVSFTAVFSFNELGLTTAPNGTTQNSFESLFHGAGIDDSQSPAFTRYTYGDQVTSPRLTTGNLGFVFNNGTGIKNYNMANVIVTKMGDIEPTGPDGYYEQDVEAVCLCKDVSNESQD